MNIVYPSFIWHHGPYNRPFHRRSQEERELINALYDLQKENWIEDWGPGALTEDVRSLFWRIALFDGYMIMKYIRQGQNTGINNVIDFTERRVSCE